MHADDIAQHLTSFIRDRFLDGDRKEELAETTPLLEWGVLNSMNIAILLNYIRDELDTKVPPAMINQENFRSVKNLTDMVVGLSAAPGQGRPGGEVGAG